MGSTEAGYTQQVCEHCSYRSAKEYNWQNRAVILAADYASNGIYNFVIPLRAHFRWVHVHSNKNLIKQRTLISRCFINFSDLKSFLWYIFFIDRKKTSLNPIILLLERQPDVAFLDAISWFPLIYWMLGSIDW